MTDPSTSAADRCRDCGVELTAENVWEPGTCRSCARTLTSDDLHGTAAGREVVTNVQGRIIGLRGGYLSDMRVLIRRAESNIVDWQTQLGDALAEADRRWGNPDA